MLELIFCAGGNTQLAHIAYECGWHLGIRSDKPTAGYPIYFVDINYRAHHPNFDRHLAVVKRVRPVLAVVSDLSDAVVNWQDIQRATRQAERLRNYCQEVLVVPKLAGQIGLLPKDIALGYPVPSSYGRAAYSLSELRGRTVHLLGGCPHLQMALYKAFAGDMHIISLDSNMPLKLATCFGKYWEAGRWVGHPLRYRAIKDLYLDCLRRSLLNIREEWVQILAKTRSLHPPTFSANSYVDYYDERSSAAGTLHCDFFPPSP
jgi:hypothetical protein